ncbi:MAG: UDP-N-acetyl-D-glucosamine dehydrogenase, partial [Anaerolineales bacterium]|nr:UDP-N-acetyl-D-glucosamine dehydrogenase [Anaerolineales bacterium]
SWKLRTLNYTARFIELASEINSSMPEYVVTKIADALNDHAKPVKGSRILVLGAAYKPNVSDVRESPAIDILLLLQQKGAAVAYHDPFIPDLHEEGVELTSVELNDEQLQSADCVVIVTNHNVYDWGHIADNAPLIVDTRNAIKERGRSSIIKL